MKIKLPRQKVHPLLVSAPMALATLRKLKTETRRLTGLDKINENPDGYLFTGFKWSVKDGAMWAAFGDTSIGDLGDPTWVKFPYGDVLDYLWLRENWHTDVALEFTKPRELHRNSPIWYAADGDVPRGFGRLRPSIHMPRWASRGLVQITSVEVQRLHNITGYEAMREGVEYRLPTARSMEQAKLDYETHEPIIKQRFTDLWITINGRASWELNPWVWVIRYRLEGTSVPANLN